MNENQIPCPIQKQYDRELGGCPQAVVLNQRNELFILNSQEKTINIHDVETFEHLYQIKGSNQVILSIWYIEDKDCIIFEEKDFVDLKTYFKIFYDWRIPRDRKTTGPLTINIPEKVVNPTSWQFTKMTPGPRVLCIANISADSNPSAQTSGNSIIIVTEKTCIIWDLEDRPKLRCVILLPLPVYFPIFSLYGDLFAIVVQENLYILKIVKGIPTSDVKPYIPGAICYDVQTELNIEFGLIEAEVSNFLFIPRYLINYPVSIEIIFRFRPPSPCLDIHFLSKFNLILLTEQASLLCTYRFKDSDADNFDPCNLRENLRCKFSVHNDDFIILSDDESLNFMPNPDKSRLDITNFSLPLLSSHKFNKIQHIGINKSFMTVIDLITNKSSIHVFNLTSSAEISSYALDSEDIDTRILGLCLLSRRDTKYSETCYSIGLALQEKGKISSSFDFFLSALNAKNPVYGEKRKSIIKMVNPKNRRKITFFVNHAKFTANDMSDDVIKMLKELPLDSCIRKLLRGKVYDEEVADADPEFPLCKLYKAVCLVSKNKHDEAKEIFKNLPDKIFANLDDHVLSEISCDLHPLILVKIGKPALPNFVWPCNERMLCHAFIHGEVDNVIKFSEEVGGEELHVSEWPVVPEEIEFYNGSEAQKICIAALIKYGTDDATRKDNVFLKGIELANSMKYKDALSILGSKTNRILFLKRFAKSCEAWNTVLQQFSEDEEIVELAKLKILELSPSQDFVDFMKNPPNIENIQDILSTLNDTDIKILQLIPPTSFPV